MAWLLNPVPDKKLAVPFNGQATDPAELPITGFGTGFWALVQNLRSSGAGLMARQGGVALATGGPPFTAYISHAVVSLNGIVSVLGAFYDGTNTRIYITSNPLSSSSTWAEITENTGNDGLTRFAGQASTVEFVVIKSYRGVLGGFNGTPRDIVAISDGLTVRIYDPGGSTVNFLWQHATPSVPNNADQFQQLATFENFIQIANGGTTYAGTSGIINQARYKFSDTSTAPYTSTNKCILLTMTSAAAAGDEAQLTFISTLACSKQLVMVVEADSDNQFQDWINNTSFQASTGSGNIAITSIVSSTGVVNATAHGLSTGNTVTITGNIAGNGTWIITVIGANSFSLNNYVAPPVSPVTGGRFSFNSGGHNYSKSIASASATTPIVITWSTTSPVPVAGQMVQVTGNSLANGNWPLGTITVSPPNSSAPLTGSATTTGTIAGGQIVRQVTLYDPTSSNSKIASPVFFEKMGDNTTLAVQYLVVFDLTSFTPAQRTFSAMQFTRLTAGINGNITILNVATSGTWAGSTGFGIAYETTNAFVETPGYVPATETTDVLSGFGGPVQVTSTGNVAFPSQKASAGSGTSITGAGFTAGALVGNWVVVTGGIGAGQTPVLILSNTATVLTTNTFGTTPDNTSIFYVSDSPGIVRGSPQLPIPTSAVFYDYDLSVKNPWIMPNTSTPGFAGGLNGVPDAVAFYVTPAGSRDNGEPGTYQYLCTRALVTPVANYQSLGPGWNYVFSTDPASFKTTEAEMATLDVTNLNPQRLLPTAYQQGIPAFKLAWSAFKRLTVTQPVQDLVARVGSVFISQDSFATRFQEFPLDRQGNLDESLGCSATFDAGQSGETVNALVGNSTEEGISSLYAFTGHCLYRLGDPTTNGSSQSSSILSTPKPLGGHGTNSPYSVCECMGEIYWLDQFGHFVKYTPNYQANFTFQSGIQDLSTRIVGDRFANLPAAQLAKVSVTSAGFLIYVAYAPVGATTNTRCLVYNALPQNQKWVSDDLLPSTWDFARLRRLYDSSRTGSGQRLIGMTTLGKLFAYEESAATDFGGTIIACRLTTGWAAPGVGFYFGQVMFRGQSETGNLTITRTYLESNDGWTSTLPLTDPKNGSFAYINGYDAKVPNDPATGRPQRGYRGFVDFAWSYTPGKIVDGISVEVIQDAPTVGGVR